MNAREPDPNNTLLNVLAGTQRVNGAQIEARGRILSLWDVLSSYSYLDAKIVRSNFYPAAIGARLANVPANSLSIGATSGPAVADRRARKLHIQPDSQRYGAARSGDGPAERGPRLLSVQRHGRPRRSTSMSTCR
jgi:outer membrane receptor protein involved in Fe transport